MDSLFTLFDVDVSLYAVIMAAAAVLCGLLFAVVGPRFKKGTKALALGLTVVLAPLCARLVYVLCRIPAFIEWEMPVFDLQATGYALIGAFLGGALACLVTAKVRKVKFAALADAMAPWAALMIALGRFAEYFTDYLGYGRSLDSVTEAALCRFPIAVANQWNEWHFAVFFVEGVTALLIFLWLMLRARKPGEAGTQVKLFLLLFFSSQVLWEQMRMDEFLRIGYFIRVTQLAGVIVLFLMMLWETVHSDRRRLSVRGAVICLIAFLLATGVCIAIEFALDKLASISNSVLYLIMLLMCGVIGYTAYRVLIGGRHQR